MRTATVILNGLTILLLVAWSPSYAVVIDGEEGCESIGGSWVPGYCSLYNDYTVQPGENLIIDIPAWHFGALRVFARLTNNGTVMVRENSAITLHDAASFENNGTVEVEGRVDLHATATFENNGSVSVSQPGWLVPAVRLHDATQLTNNGTIDLDACGGVRALRLTDTARFVNNETVTLLHGSIELTGAATFENNDQVLLTRGHLGMYSNVTLDNYGTVTVEWRARIWFEGRFNNFGTIDNHGLVSISGGEFLNTAPGVIHNRVDGTSGGLIWNLGYLHNGAGATIQQDPFTVVTGEAGILNRENSLGYSYFFVVDLPCPDASDSLEGHGAVLHNEGSIWLFGPNPTSYASLQNCDLIINEGFIGNWIVPVSGTIDNSPPELQTSGEPGVLKGRICVSRGTIRHGTLPNQSGGIIDNHEGMIGKCDGGQIEGDADDIRGPAPVSCPNSDDDPVCDVCDCHSGASSAAAQGGSARGSAFEPRDVWWIPSEVRALRLEHAGGVEGVTQLTWVPPGNLGGTFVHYDVVSSGARDDFSSGTASCLESDEPGEIAFDSTVLDPHGIRYFVVRAVNTCGNASSGGDSLGNLRSVRECP